ncbi:MAG: S9 family peptidase, partial [Pseudobdellovibrionaceae bacterium]|nr:S9 family peptidase [Pseudobdellovibrionaceae bacterium]
LYEPQAKKLTKLFTSRPELEGKRLAPMHPVEIEARDGTILPSYLSLPPDADSDGDGKPAKALPLVLLVHGGPWARDSFGYNATHQWLANRGMAVLSVNYRGSTGFGKDFINKAKREFAGAMHNDLLDGVNWAIKQGIAQKDKVGIMGGSYGGYATLVGMTFTPDVFACGVDIVGPSNLVTLIESFPAYWQPFLDKTWYKWAGNPSVEADKKDLMARSPITKVNQIKKPLLIGQGANDPRVTQKESDQIVAAMKVKSIPVTYALYPDEGHGFHIPQNRISFNSLTENFFAKCLGTAAQPIGKDIVGSSLQLPEGREHIPGLKEAFDAIKK